MTKIKRSITINADLDNAIGRLATRIGQSNSQLIENILRTDDRINKLTTEFQTADEIPDYNSIPIPKKIPA